MVNEMEKQAYSEKKVEKNPWLIEDEKPVVSKVMCAHYYNLCIGIGFHALDV